MQLISTAEIKVPHRISGFFQMMDPQKMSNIQDPLLIGSRGGGPALTAYGRTVLKVYSKKSQDQEASYRIFINQKEMTSTATTSIATLKLMHHLIPKDYHLDIIHDFDLLLGSGYGSSGAGALGISLGLKNALKLEESPLELAKYAHIAEVMSHTGLGTVGGQFYGGLTITKEPGYPFQVHQVNVPKDVDIVLASFGSISTKAILTDPKYKELIFRVGEKAMERMDQDYSLENYLDVCQYFLTQTDLLTKLKLDILSALLTKVKSFPIIGAGMNQLGKSIFIFSQTENTPKILKSLNSIKSLKMLKICKVEKKSLSEMD